MPVTGTLDASVSAGFEDLVPVPILDPGSGSGAGAYRNRPVLEVAGTDTVT